MKKWIAYTFILAFAAYWASNLLLWFPWSYSTTLGITLMLTVAPLIWAYITFLALKSYPQISLYKGAAIIALVLLLSAVIMNYVFFGLIRDAMEELYHPTTFYGYGFLVFWPFLLAFVFRKKLLGLKKEITNTAIFQAAISGLVCLGVLVLIIVFGIEI